MGRTVTDVAKLFSVIAGKADARDPVTGAVQKNFTSKLQALDFTKVCAGPWHE